MANPLEGSADLVKKLRALKGVAATKVLRSVVRAGIRPAQKRAVELIPQGSRAHRTYKGRLVGPGFASRNTRVVTRATPTGASAALGVRREAFYAVQFVERRLGKSQYTGREWLQPAFEQTQTEQVAEAVGKLKKLIDGAARGQTPEAR